MELPQQPQGQAPQPAPTTEQPPKADAPDLRKFSEADLAEIVALDDDQIRELGIEAEVAAARARGIQPAAPKDDDEDGDPAPAAGGTAPHPQKQPEASPANDQGQKPGGPPPGLIAERQRRQHAEQMLAQMQAQIAHQEQILAALMAGKQMGGQAASAATEAPQVDPLAEIEAKRAEIDRKYDDGELDYAEAQKQQRALDREERKLERQQAQAPAQAQQPTESLMLSQATMAIEAANPWLNQLQPAQVEAIADMAERELRFAGVDLAGERGNLALRQHFVNVGRRLLGIQDPPAQDQPSTKTQPNQQRAPGVTPDQLAAKLALGSTHPPDLSNLPRSNGAAPGDMTVADLERLSLEQVRSLPKATKDRLKAAHGVE